MNKRFLIINPFGIGDVLFTIPMIKNIRANVPDAFIGYIANRRTAPLLENLPLINKVTIYDRDKFKATADRSIGEYLALLINTKNEIRDARYDLCFDLSMTGYAAFYCLWAGIRQRVGLDYKNRSFFLSQKIPIRDYENRHVVEYYLDLLRENGFKVTGQSMTIAISQKEQKAAQEFLLKVGLPSKPYIVIFPGGGESWGQDAKFKRWPSVKYAELINELGKEYQLGILLMGSGKEESLCNEIQSLVKWPFFNACGKTNLLQSMAVLKASALAVVNDGGPLHMAVAAGTKTVSVFGPVDENVYGPYSTGDHHVVTSPVVCRPCYHQFRRAACDHMSCIRNVEVDSVLRSIQKILI